MLHEDDHMPMQSITAPQHRHSSKVVTSATSKTITSTRSKTWASTASKKEASTKGLSTKEASEKEASEKEAALAAQVKEVLDAADTGDNAV